MSITHQFVSGKSDGSDATQVQPSNWNAAHNIGTPTSLLSSDGVLTGTDVSGNLTLNGVKATAKYQHLRRNAGNTAFEAALIDYLKTPSGISSSDIGILLGTDDGSGNSLISGLSASAPLQFLRRKGNVSSKTYEFASFDNRRAIDYNFTAVSITQTLTSGISNTVTLPFGILGLAGTNTKHYIRINDTVGTSETVKITGGTATSGTAGTLTFKCAYAHTSGNWTLESATYGGAEAQWTLSSNGGSVEFPSGTLVFKGPLHARGLPVWFKGQNRDSSIISIDTASFPSTIDSVAVLGGVVFDTGSGTYSDAGIISDLSIKFTQPDVTNPASMTSYFPGIYNYGTSHLKILRVNVELAYDAIKIDNVNGVTISDCGFSYFHTCIDIDRSFDTVFIEKIITWPFGCTANQATAFLSTSGVLLPYKIGHIDALYMNLCVSNVQGGYTAKFYTGADGYGPTAFISNCWFDGIGNILVQSGTVEISNCYQTVYDNASAVAGVHINNADVRMTNCIQVQTGTVVNTPVKFIPTGNSILTPAAGRPNLQISNCKMIQGGGLDSPYVEVQCSGASVVMRASIQNCHIEKPSGGTYVFGLFYESAASGGGSVIFNVKNNSVNDIAGGTGVFCNLITDVFHDFQGNNCGGYSFTLPATVVNTTWRNNINALLNFHRFQEEIKLQNGTASALTGAATLAKQAGVITSEAITTAAAASYTLILTNTKVTTTSICFASVFLGTSTTGTPQIVSVTPTANTLTIIVKNIHATAAFNGTIKISFLVLNT